MSTSSSTILFFLIISLSSSDGTELIIVNNCKETIWPGLLGTAGQPTPNSGGFRLGTGEEHVLQLPANWSGRLWPRKGCRFHDQTGTCQTGDCSGLLSCSGLGGKPPATTVQMTLGTPESPLHFYDVSLVDGFNVPVSMAPVGAVGWGPNSCQIAACEADLNEVCPAALAMRRGESVVGCKSACLAAGTGRSSDRYCCRGEYSGPEKCKPTVFGRVFKTVCPKAYSYPFDEASALMTCIADRYVITFCPPVY